MAERTRLTARLSTPVSPLSWGAAGGPSSSSRGFGLHRAHLKAWPSGIDRIQGLVRDTASQTCRSTACSGLTCTSIIYSNSNKEKNKPVGPL